MHRPRLHPTCVVLLLSLLAWGIGGCSPAPLDAQETPTHTVFLPYVTTTPPATPPVRHTWSALYGGEGAEEMEGLAITPDGGLVIGGGTDSFADENGDAWILALNADGTVRRQRTYGGEGDEALVDIRPTPDGGYIAVGWTDSFGAAQTDMWVVRLNDRGDVLWSKIYGGPGIEQAWSVDLTPDGGYLIAGGTTSFGAGGADYWVLRLDAQGDIVWQRTYGGPADDGGGSDYEEFVVRALVDQDGNYVVVSESASFGAGETDIWLLKLRPDGSVIWQKAYGGEYEDSLWSFDELAGGGYLLPGVTTSFSPDLSGDTWVLAVTPDGAIRWQKILALANVWDEALSATATQDGGAVIGAYYEEGSTDWDMTLLRVDGQGNLIWQRRYEYGWDWPNALAEMPDGSLALAGVAWDRDQGRDLDLWAMHLAADGTVAGTCTPIQDLQVQVQDTAAVPTDTQATVQETHVTPKPVTVTVRDTGLAPRLLCPADSVFP